ncbi:MAG: hypothetical protein Q4C67_07255 [Deinococcus sp.]|nr:hypothetical protein [Deinococcus sp.]
MPGKLLGAGAAAVGGLVFVLVNAGSLPGPWPWLLRGLGALAFVWVLVRLRQPGGLKAGRRPDARSWHAYVLSVGLMLLAFPLGARALSLSGHAEYILPWVVLVVGLHFFPFASAFGAPVFRGVAAGLVAAALLGAGLTALGLPWGAAAGAVAAGFILLAYSGGLGQPKSLPS